jgi:hypothetical protein
MEQRITGWNAFLLHRKGGVDVPRLVQERETSVQQVGEGLIPLATPMNK